MFLQLKVSASFTDDLGLDSLDAVEVVMAVEEVWFDTPPPCFTVLIDLTRCRSFLLKFPMRRQMPFKQCNMVALLSSVRSVHLTQIPQRLIISQKLRKVRSSFIRPQLIE